MLVDIKFKPCRISRPFDEPFGSFAAWLYIPVIHHGDLRALNPDLQAVIGCPERQNPV